MKITKNNNDDEYNNNNNNELTSWKLFKVLCSNPRLLILNCSRSGPYACHKMPHQSQHNKASHKSFGKGGDSICKVNITCIRKEKEEEKKIQYNKLRSLALGEADGLVRSLLEQEYKKSCWHLSLLTNAQL